MAMHVCVRLVPGALLGLWLSLAAAAQTSGAAPTPVTPSNTPAAVGGELPARLSDAEGAVRVTSVSPAAPETSTPDNVPAPPPDTVYDTAQVNMPLLPGAVIQTGADGRAELELNDGSLARATPNSSIGLVTETSEGELLQSLAGLTYYESPGSMTGQMAIRLGAFRLTPSLESLVRIDMDTKPYQVSALRGTVQLADEAAGVIFTVAQGQSATIDPENPTDYTVTQELAATSWDQWNADRDDILAQMAVGETTARSGSPNADSDAWNDLDYYGTWYDVPGAGEAWAPDGVDASFDPYGNGSWSYYNNVGIVWISAYQWGWLPYHCGNWNNLPGFGWMWQPLGGCGVYGGRGWFPYTGISHVPVNYRLPLYQRTVNQRMHPRITGVPIGPVHPVDRQPSYRFRVVGGSRPNPRQLAIPVSKDAAAGSFASTLPVVEMPRAEYRSDGSFAAAPSGRPAYVPQPRSTLATSPRILEPPPYSGRPMPRIESPPPHVEAPHPEPSHVDAPAAHAH